MTDLQPCLVFPRDLEEILVKLKFIAMTEKGQKINTTNMTLVNGTSWYSAYYRSLNGEGRNNTLRFLKDVVIRAIELIAVYKHQVPFLRYLITDLAHAKIGIINLTTTYQEDHLIRADLSTLVGKIDIQLGEYRTYLQGFIGNPVILKDSEPMSIPSRPSDVAVSSPCPIKNPFQAHNPYLSDSPIHSYTPLLPNLPEKKSEDKKDPLFDLSETVLDPYLEPTL